MNDQVDRNGLNLKMSREQFLAYDDQQQKGIMFSFLTSIDKKLDDKFATLNKNGCAFAQKYLQISKYLRWKMIGVGFAIAIPVVYLLVKIFIP
jgi:hypothetical protein